MIAHAKPRRGCAVERQGGGGGGKGGGGKKGPGSKMGPVKKLPYLQTNVIMDNLLMIESYRRHVGK